MKRFTTLLMSMFFAVAAFGQSDVVVEELWNDSKQANGSENEITGEWEDGDYPSWMGDAWGGTERGMAHLDGKLYIPSRADEEQKITVIDAIDGSVFATIQLPTDQVTGGLYPLNNISTTASGDLVLGNLSGGTQNVDEETGDPSDPFKAYVIELNATGDDFETITEVVNWNNVDAGEEAPNYRLGDGIAFYGDVADGETGYLICPVQASDHVLRWDVTDGTFAEDPVVFQVKDSNPAPADGDPVSLGTAPQAFPVSENLVIIDGGNLFPAVYDMDGNMVSTFGEVSPFQPNANGVCHFTLENRSFVVAQSTVWSDHGENPENAFELFELVNDDWTQAESIGFLPAEGLSTDGSSNASFNYPVVADVVDGEAYIYGMGAKLGIAGFKVTIDENVSVGDAPQKDAVSVYPNPATDVVNFSEEMASVKIYDMSGKFVREVTNTSQINVSNLRGMFLLNATDKQGNAVRKTVMIK